MFPGPGARVYYNDAGEPLGWDYPDTDGPPYCDECGAVHVGPCEPWDDDS